MLLFDGVLCSSAGERKWEVDVPTALGDARMYMYFMLLFSCVCTVHCLLWLKENERKNDYRVCTYVMKSIKTTSEIARVGQESQWKL